MRLAGDPVAGAILHRAFGPTVHESCDEFLAILASLSDGSGAGEIRNGPTELASDIRHADRTSREIHAVSGVSHNYAKATDAFDAVDCNPLPQAQRTWRRWVP